MIVRVCINHLDGRQLASGGTFSNESMVWPWVVETIAHHFEIDESEIGCDDEDRVTINGVPTFEIFKHYRTIHGKAVLAEAAE